MFSISHTPIHYALFSIVMFLSPLLYGAEKPIPKVETKLLFEHREPIRHMALSPDGRTLVVAGEEKRPTAYLTDKTREMLVYGHVRTNTTYNIPSEIIILVYRFYDPLLDIDISSSVQQLLWAPSTNSFAYKDTDGQIGIHNFTTCSSQFLEGHNGGVKTMCWSPKSLFFAAAVEDGVYIWDTQNLSDKPRSIKYDRADSISFCDEDTIAIAGKHKYTEIYRYKESTKASAKLSILSDKVKYTHCKGNFLISTDEITVHLWDISEKKNKAIIPVYKEHVYDMVSIDFLPSCEYLLFGTLDALSIWHINEECKNVKTHKEEEKDILCSCCSHNDQFTAYALTDSTIRIFSTDERLSNWKESWKKDVDGSPDIKLQWDPYVTHLYSSNNNEVYLTKIT